MVKKEIFDLISLTIIIGGAVTFVSSFNRDVGMEDGRKIALTGIGILTLGFGLAYVGKK